MKKVFILVAALSLHNSFAQEKGGEVGNPVKGQLEEYVKALNSDATFERLKKAAQGDKDIAREEMGRFVREYCEKTKKCSWGPLSDLDIKGEVAVAFAKIQLKTYEESNLKYAQTMIELNQKLSECQEEAGTLFTQDFKESCSEEFTCKGKNAEELRDLFKEYKGFETKKIGTVHRELSEEEKMVNGADISFMLNQPVENNNLYGSRIDAVYPKFAMAPVLQTRKYYSNEKKMFTTKMERTTLDTVKFDKNYIPDGIMTLRALDCSEGAKTKGDSVKKDELSCKIHIGNTAVDTFEQVERKACLEKHGIFASFFNFFKKKKESVQVNDSDRDKIKAVETETLESQTKSSRSSER